MIYFMRHGQTVWNLEGRLQGHRDSPLTALGERQALAYGACLKRALAGGPPPRFLCSPLGRARQTAALVAGVIGFDAAAIEIEPRLAERAFGTWEGLTYEALERDHAAAWRHYRANRWSAPAPEGESFADVARRLRAWLDEIGEAPLVVAVGHGGAGRILRGLYAGMAPAVMLELTEPQDRVFRLAGGAIEELPAG